MARHGDKLIVGGDWKARPGAVDTATWHILGKFAVGTRCANCDRLVNFESAKRPVVSSIRFQRPKRHPVTWVSNDRRTSNQINLMLVRPRWASSVIDCQVYNEAQADSGHDSNHAMLRTCLRLHMKAARISNRPAKLDTEKLDKQRVHYAYWEAIAAAWGAKRKQYQMLKSLGRRPAGVGEILLERDESTFPDQAGKLCRWEEHSKELLNHAVPPNTAFSLPDTSSAKN